ncbi:MAG: tetratricopeptide repeat-containing sulfotransferase family protein [Gammaproteobacteria bacterium]
MDTRDLIEQARVLGEQGDIQGAKLRLRQAHTQQPDSAFAVGQLANAMNFSGESQQALALLEDWLEHHPDEYPLWLLAGDIAARADKSDSALVAWERASRGPHPVKWPALLKRGNLQLLLAQAPAARASFQAVLDGIRSISAADPGIEAAAWSGLGYTLLDLYEFESARNAFERALTLTPDRIAAQAGLTEALYQTHREQEALDLVLQVLSVDPENVLTLVIYGKILIDRGHYEEAETALHKALELAPWHSGARLNMTRLKRILGRDEEATRDTLYMLGDNPDIPAYFALARSRRLSRDDPIFTQLQRRLETLDQAPLTVQEDAIFALAKAYEDFGEYPQATKYLQQGNTLHRKHSAYNVAHDETLMEQMATFFSPKCIKRLKHGKSSRMRPIFITSLPRSGSTLVEQMLASHSQVTGGGELNYMTLIASEIDARWSAQTTTPGQTPEPFRHDLRQAAELYAEATRGLRGSNRFFTDKNLGNFLYLGLIPLMLPQARIVHLRRHPLAAALGLYRQRFGYGLEYGYDLHDFIRYYRAYRKLMAHWNRVLPGCRIDVYYETLVMQPERELRRILDYIGLDFEPACLEFHKLERPVNTASTSQVRQPLDQRGIERHTHYLDLLAPVAEELAEEIAAYERAIETARPRP